MDSICSDSTELDGERKIMTDLIHEYKSQSLLWDASHPLYFNKDARQNGYDKLLLIYKKAEPGANVKGLKKKLENMRNTFNREFKKVEESLKTGQGTQNIYSPKLWYYDLLKFLNGKKFRTARDTLDGSKEGRQKNDETEEEVIEGQKVPEKYESSDQEIISPPQIQSSGEDSASCGSSEPRNTSTPVPRKRMKLSLRKKQKDLIIDGRCLMKVQESEIDVFGRSVAEQLKTLNRTQKVICQKLISDALFHGKLDQLTTQSSISLVPVSSQSAPIYIVRPDLISSNLSQSSSTSIPFAPRTDPQDASPFPPSPSTQPSSHPWIPTEKQYYKRKEEQ